MKRDLEHTVQSRIVEYLIFKQKWPQNKLHRVLENVIVDILYYALTEM